MAEIFLLLGSLFLIGLATDLVANTTQLPRVSLLLLAGFAIGPYGLDLLPFSSFSLKDFVSQIALAMVGFLLGGHLTLTSLRNHGKQVLVLSLAISIATFLVVSCALWLIGLDLPLAVILGAMATATDPAASLDVSRHDGAQGPFTETLIGIVAIDDVWGLVLFILAVTLAGLFQAQDTGWSALIHGGYELGSALFVGLALGLPMAILTGRIQPGEPTQAEALGFVLLCVGLAQWIESSYLLAAMVMGSTVANLAQHHSRLFNEIEGIEWPFLMLFFMLAGASLDPGAVQGGIGFLLAYIIFRIVGRLTGAWFGAITARVPEPHRLWFGPALLPQAGVALGMALIAAEQFPQYAGILMSVSIAATVFFELLGPVVLHKALVSVGETKV